MSIDYNYVFLYNYLLNVKSIGGGNSHEKFILA